MKFSTELPYDSLKAQGGYVAPKIALSKAIMVAPDTTQIYLTGLSSW